MVPAGPRFTVLAECCLCPAVPPPGQLGRDLWGIAPECFSGPPRDAVSYRIFLINYFQPKLARVGLSYFHLRTL